MKTDKIDLRELEDFLKLIEGQRDLSYHLLKYKEALSERLKELEIIKTKAQRVQQLKHTFLKVYPQLKHRLPEEQTKAINNILQARHINI